MSLISDLFSVFFPTHCFMCGKRTFHSEDFICASCNMQMPRTHYAENPYNNYLAQVFWGRIPIEKASSLFFYNPDSKPATAIYDLKYHNHPEIGVDFGKLMAQEFSAHDFFKDIDVIVPLPLAKNRLRERGYNQSEMIAQGVKEITGIPINTGIVERTIYKESQTHKDRWSRYDNVEGVYHLLNANEAKGKHILLIDDVITSGATICSCANEIAKAGNVKFSVISLGFAKK